MKFACPSCDQHIEADEAFASVTIVCPTCGTSIQAPSLRSTLARPSSPLTLQPKEAVGTIENEGTDVPPTPVSAAQKSSASASRGPGRVILYLFKTTGISIPIAVFILVVLRNVLQNKGRGLDLMAMQLTIMALITLAGIGIACLIAAPVMRAALKWVEKSDVSFEYVYKTCFLIAYVLVIMLDIAGAFKVQRGLFLPLYFLIQTSLTSYCLRISFGRSCLIALVMGVIYLGIGLMLWLLVPINRLLQHL